MPMPLAMPPVRRSFRRAAIWCAARQVPAMWVANSGWQPRPVHCTTLASNNVCQGALVDAPECCRHSDTSACARCAARRSIALRAVSRAAGRLMCGRGSRGVRSREAQIGTQPEDTAAAKDHTPERFAVNTNK